MAKLARSLRLLALITLASCRPSASAVAPVAPGSDSQTAASTTPDVDAYGDDGGSEDGVQAAAVEGPATVLSEADGRKRADAIAALDQGRYTEARVALESLLERYPSSASLQGLRDAAAQAEKDLRTQAVGAFARMQATALAEPPWRYTFNAEVPGARGNQPALKQLSAEKNAVTDDERWFAENGIALPLWEVPNPHMGRKGELPANIPDAIGTNVIVRAIAHEDHAVLLYGPDFSGGTIVVVLDPDGKVLCHFDFSAYRTAPHTKAGDGAFVDQRVSWAQLQDGVLFVSTGHSTYAASSGGDNAYITALDASSGKLLWRSQPLVAGAVNFLLHDGWIITGYGFTAEPDFLYLLGQNDGKVAKKIKLKTGPSYFAKKDNTLLVRTYDMNYVFAL